MLAQTFLCFDFGTRRVGVATGNSLLGLAQPLKTLSAEGDARFAQALAGAPPVVLAAAGLEAAGQTGGGHG